MATTYTPQIYVGTYAKYNDGSLEGQWFDMEDYSNAEEFHAACQEFHGVGEHEFMYQDMADCPEGMVSESSISAEFWDWLALDDYEKELLAVYRDHVDADGTLEDAQDSFMGTADSPEDWAEEFLADTGGLDGMAENLKQYFDYKAYARDCGFDGTTFANHDRLVWVFHS